MAVQGQAPGVPGRRVHEDAASVPGSKWHPRVWHQQPLAVAPMAHPA